jgi:transposase
VSNQSTQVNSFEMTDEMWARITPLLPLHKKKIKKGRPRLDDRLAMTAIFYKLHHDCSWKALPVGMGAGSTIYDRYKEWLGAGVFDKLRQAGVLSIDQEEEPA